MRTFEYSITQSMSRMSASILCKISAGIAIACVMGSSHAQVADTRWRVRVMDLRNKIRVEGTIRLTDKPETGSCIVGNWRKAVVEAKTISGEKFFPLTEPLAYTVENGEITFGRTRTCDGYLFLTGKLDKKTIRGTFHAPGPGYDQQLGSFSLTNIR